MKKTSIGLVVGILAITALILTSGTAFANSTTNATNDTNATNATANATANATTNETNVTNATVLPTEPVEDGSTAIVPESTENEPSSDGDENVVSTGTVPEQTTASTPKEGPGFGSIIAIVMILSAIYVFRMNKK